MAACGGLEHIFDNPLPESPTFLETLSPWKQIKSLKTVDHSSFTDIFGGLCFEDNHVHVHDRHELSSSSSPLSCLSSSSAVDIPKTDDNGKNGTSSYEKKQYGHSESFSSMNSESLSLCTEGLGLESCDDVEDDRQPQEERTSSFTRNTPAENQWGEIKRSRTSIGEFPPPISCIGRSGKPWVCFKSFRQDGRENGRLRLQFIQSDDEIFEEDEEDEEEDEEEDAGRHDDDDDTNGEKGEENIESGKWLP
ncbi:hypothetical protein CDL12_27015 [Handroanthus impetiginosus]|uniref:FAF domain-containing protein n=1 Tax=Handroanthus impetiginosus TaxID=429701 RepID=A0A2G9G6C7_9LAMI|nr:hypothetical protein CDL12_27015 [Handroanthus impetiginosus]